jgi:hypothetical protein
MFQKYFCEPFCLPPVLLYDDVHDAVLPVTLCWCFQARFIKVSGRI